FAYVSPVQMSPSCDQTGTPAMAFDGFFHFRSSIISGSASRISARMRARVSSRQSCDGRGLGLGGRFAWLEVMGSLSRTWSRTAVQGVLDRSRIQTGDEPYARHVGDARDDAHQIGEAGGLPAHGPLFAFIEIVHAVLQAELENDAEEGGREQEHQPRPVG